MLEQVLALLAAVLIVDIDGQPFEIEIDAIAEEKHQNHRHEDDNDQAARVAQDLHRSLFLRRPAGESGSWLALLRRLAPRRQRDKDIFQARANLLHAAHGDVACSQITLKRGMAGAASSTTRCKALPKTAASITPGAVCSASTASPSGAHSTRSSSPLHRIALQFRWRSQSAQSCRERSAPGGCSIRPPPCNA